MAITSILILNLNSLNNTIINLLDILKNLISNLNTITHFVTYIISDFNLSYIYEIFFVGIIFSGKAIKTVLDTTAKIVSIGAGSTVIYNNFKGSSEGSSNNDDKKIKQSPRATIQRIKQGRSRRSDCNHILIPILTLLVLPLLQPQQRSHIINWSRRLYSPHFKISFSLPFILSWLDINIDNSSSNLVNLSYGVLLLSLVALICFINIIGFMIAYFIIQSRSDRWGKILKYPKLNKFINYYKKTTLVYVTIEIILCLTCLLLLVFFSILYIYSGTGKI